MVYITKKAIENRIKDCIRNKDYITAENYYKNYKEQFNDLNYQKLIDDVNKPIKHNKKEDKRYKEE